MCARHDRFKEGIDLLREYANPKSPTFNEGIAELVKSMNDTLTNHIL